MAKILHLDASPRGDRSVSRQLAREFLAARAADSVTYRDIGRETPPFVSENWVAGAFAAPAERTPEAASAIAVSDLLVDELLAADLLVIGAPMYNLSVPAQLKAWIDQIVRAGRTFAIGESGYIPLVHGKKAVVILASGGALAGTPYDFEEPYLRAVLGFIGITDVTFVRAENMNMGEEAKAAGLAAARAKLAALAVSR